MKYTLCQFADNPPAKRPSGMNAIAGWGVYLNPQNAMKYLRPRATAVVFPSGKPTAYIGLYDSDDNLVVSEEYKP